MTSTSPGSTIERLAASLLPPGADGTFAEELTGWLAGSARFRAFAEANEGKIRKKLRGVRDDGSLGDVRAELQSAHLLLADRRIELAYEAYGSGNAGPDFTVTYRATKTFNVEVTRLRRVPDPAALGQTILAKLRQLPPSVPNILLIATGAASAGTVDVATAARLLRAKAESRDDQFFTGHGLSGTRGFNDRYLRLGAVIWWSEGATSSADRAAIWTNPSARVAIDARASEACLRCLRVVD
ncbi:MAG TPA: hypothetical protein VGM28_04050 [Candidatus Limnocylindrales bacterium]|jgi:hypothetical protein